MKRPEANRRQSERRRGESRWRDTAREMKRRGGETLLERWRDEVERHCSRDGETRRRGKSRLERQTETNCEFVISDFFPQYSYVQPHLLYNENIFDTEFLFHIPIFCNSWRFIIAHI